VRRRPNCRSVEFTSDTGVVAVLWQRPLVQSTESLAVPPFPLIREHVSQEPHRIRQTLDSKISRSRFAFMENLSIAFRVWFYG
jgi:hypothetical protein